METEFLKSERKTPFSIFLFIIFLPFVLLYWMIPFITGLTLGADYQIFSINEQLELLFSIKTGSFPLYVPGYKFGHSASALTLSQVYHPISHISSLMPGYWDGKALEWNTLFRFLSLGLTHLILFAFLRKIKLDTLFSFIISFITVYNLRMLEAFRYGASLEAFTGHLLLCTLIGWYFISPSRWLGPLCIIGATYLLICSGHPPMMFYGILGAVIFTLVAPFFITTMLSDRDVDFKIAFRFWTRVGFYMCLGILLSSAYILPFYVEFITTNIEYRSIASATSYIGEDTFVGALNNFFMPFISDVLSAFGGSSLFLIALLMPLLRCCRVKIPPSIWVIWGIWLFTFFYIQGPQTPIYRWAWEYLPFISSTGGVGRISIIVPLLMMMLLAWIVNVESLSIRLKSLSVILTPYTYLGIIALILIPVYLLSVFLLKPELGNFTPHFIRNIPFGIEFVSVLLGMVSLLALIFYGMYPRLVRALGFFLCMMVLLHVGTILKYGTFIERKIDKPTFDQINVHKKEKIDYNYHQNPSLFHSVVLNHLSRSFMEPFLGKIFTQVIPVSSQDDAYKNMERERFPQQIFVEEYDAERAETITEGAKGMKEGAVELIYSSFNRLRFKVNSEAPAFFGLSYPYTGHWSARVNGEEGRIYRANGAAHAIEIPEGESVIEFRYWSEAFFGGMVVSFTAFAMIGLFACFRGLQGLPRILGIVAVLIISAGGFMMWYSSLYSGDNLETEYAWSFNSPLKTPNLAYGKNTLSHYLHESSELRLNSSRVVDGDIRPDSGVTIGLLEEALIIDLNQIEEIEAIVLYGNLTTLPKISLSKDNIQWQRVDPLVFEDQQASPMRIIIKESRDKRFIKVMAGKSDIIIDEIEVYRKKVNY